MSMRCTPAASGTSFAATGNRCTRQSPTWKTTANECTTPRHARGLPIGSGNVEATCKSLAALRMNSPGARWNEESGQHILDLQALVPSERWDAAMNLTLAPQRAGVRRAA